MTLQQLLAQALPLHQAGRLAEAEPLYRQMLALDRASYPALHLMGLMRLQQNRLPEALEFMKAALAAQPGAPDTLANYGIALSALDRHDEALAAMDGVVAARPDAQAFSNRGAIKSKLGRLDQALADFDRAVALDAKNIEALNNRGLTLHALRRYDQALAAFDQLMTLAPDYAEGRNNRGLTLRELGRQRDALEDFERVVRQMPGHAGAWVNRAGTLWKLERLEEALESYGTALALDPDLPEALESRSSLLWTRRQALAPAIADLERAVKVAPGLPYVEGTLLHLKMHAGDWRGFDSAKAKLDAAVRAGKPAATPFVYQGLSDSPADFLSCVRHYAAREFPALPPVKRASTRRPGRIRIGYVCGEFRAQATMYLAAGLFEHHDRARFEIFAFDNGRDDASPTRARVTAAFDHFITIADLSDRAAAEAVAAADIDILVNLNGYFGKLRMNVFAARAAPIQVNYLGFPGSLGADYMDYIMADAVVIPPEEHRFYVEKVVRLPGSYQVNDNRRAAIGATTRAAHGLPRNAFVFCHFNYGYKITPDCFAVWMRILQQAEGSVLWLLAGDPLLAENLKSAAARQGVDPGRLIFAPSLPLADHMARLALGDLFLDTFVSNAHTTASDALWAGLPLLTRRGTAFQGRVAASLLLAMGLDELVTEDAAHYEARALRLAREPARMKDIRDRLEKNRGAAPLFDTARTTRHIELAYERMQARRLDGEAPQSFAVAPV